MHYRTLLFSVFSLSLFTSPLIASTEGLNQEAYLKAINPGSDTFGAEVAISGRFAVVATAMEDSGGRGVDPSPDETGTDSGAVYVYERINGVWTFHSFLKSSNSDPDDHFGSSVAIKGNFLAVGAVGESSNADGVDGDESNNDAPNSGAVYVFRLDGDSWVQESALRDADPYRLPIQSHDLSERLVGIAVTRARSHQARPGRVRHQARANGGAFRGDGGGL